MRDIQNELIASEKRARALCVDLELHRFAWPFRLHERVQLSKTCEYYDEYRDTELHFAGATIDRHGNVNACTISPGEGITDDWSMDDLERWVEP